MNPLKKEARTLKTVGFGDPQVTVFYQAFVGLHVMASVFVDLRGLVCGVCYRVL